MTVATAVQVFPDIDGETMHFSDIDGETMHFSAYNICGDFLCKIAIDASEPAKSLVLKMLECMGGCVREHRQARDGANYDFDEFVKWYTIDLAVKRWAEAPVSVRKKEQKITLLLYGSQMVTPRLLACPLWSFPRVEQNTRLDNRVIDLRTAASQESASDYMMIVSHILIISFDEEQTRVYHNEMRGV